MASAEQIQKLLEAWYKLIGRKIAPTEAERERDLAAVKRSLISFEAEQTLRGKGKPWK